MLPSCSATPAQLERKERTGNHGYNHAAFDGYLSEVHIEYVTFVLGKAEIASDKL